MTPTIHKTTEDVTNGDQLNSFQTLTVVRKAGNAVFGTSFLSDLACVRQTTTIIKEHHIVEEIK